MGQTGQPAGACRPRRASACHQDTYRWGHALHLAIFDRSTQAKIEALRSHSPAFEELVRDLDVLLISKVGEEIFRRPPGKNAVLIVNLDFSTFDNTRGLGHLTRVSNTFTGPARAALIFNREDSPGLLPAKVAEHFFGARHFCRAMMAQIATPALGNTDLQMLRTPVVTFNAWDLTKRLAPDSRKGSRPSQAAAVVEVEAPGARDHQRA